MHLAPRYRLPVAILASLAVVVVVLVAVIVAGGGGPTASPTPSSSISASASTDPTSTPEGAVRAFFDAFSAARRTDDPTGLRPFVTGSTSSAYLSVQGFLEGQKAVKKASIVTVQRLDNLTTTINGESATVTFDYTEGGYDIDLASGSALESPQVLSAYQVTVTLNSSGSHWLVDAYTSRQ